MDKIKTEEKSIFKTMFKIFSIMFLYLAAILLIFVELDITMWKIFLYTAFNFLIIVVPMTYIFDYQSKKSKITRQAIILGEVPVIMYPYAYQDPKNYFFLLNSFYFFLNILLGIFLIIGSIFISGNILVIIIESILGIIAIFSGILFFIKNKNNIGLLKQIFLSFFN